MRPLRPEDRETVLKLKQRLLAAGVPLEEVWAFGSRVRRDFDDESDLDVLLVLRDRRPEIDSILSRIGWEVGYEAGYVVSAFGFTRAELEGFPLRISPLVEAVRSEGVRV